MKEISSLQNPIVKHLAKLQHNRDYRYEHRRIVIEGEKMVAEVCSDVQPLTLFAVDPAVIPSHISCKETYIVSEEILAKIAGAHAPEGVIAEIPMPQSKPLKKCGSLLVLDNVSDPGNLGALLRSAVAFGWEGAFLLTGSCDPFNDKALRSARGATFRLPLAWGSWADLDKIIAGNSLTPLVADLRGKSLSQIGTVKAPLLIVGNESGGVSKEASKRSEAVTISMSGTMESLNVSVAGGIMMYVLGNARGKK